ncbi:hypothetical protein AVEN_256660-1 [Araneus ventricosus]|uniref:Uncharacterized protein n=1 Tax=Araneus ventricosus TaxID=182803 RepID=A0A4Y2RJC3_ARAVE|nr:hypothetical protein AVEN_256660-1 [Araneus ventricosus]
MRSRASGSSSIFSDGSPHPSKEGRKKTKAKEKEDKEASEDDHHTSVPRSQEVKWKVSSHEQEARGRLLMELSTVEGWEGISRAERRGWGWKDKIMGPQVGTPYCLKRYELGSILFAQLVSFRLEI